MKRFCEWVRVRAGRGLLVAVLVGLCSAGVFPGRAHAIQFFDCLIDFFSTECRRSSRMERPADRREDQIRKDEKRPASEDGRNGFPLPMPESTPPEMKRLLDDPSPEAADELAAKIEEAFRRWEVGGEYLAEAMQRRWREAGRTPAELERADENLSRPRGIPSGTHSPKTTAANSRSRVPAAAAARSTQPSQDGHIPSRPSGSFDFMDVRKPTIVYFLKDTCPWCIRQEPILEEVRRQFGGQVDVVAVARKDWITGTRSVPFRLIVSDSIVDQVGVKATPTLLVIRPGSSRVIALEGLQSAAEIERALRE